MQGHARAIVTKVQLIRDGDDERTDLKNAAKLYAGALEKRLPQLREGVRLLCSSPGARAFTNLAV